MGLPSRQVFVRHTTSALVGAVLSTTALTPAWSAGSLFDLGWLATETKYGEANAVNSAGTVVVGASNNSEPNSRAVIWRPGGTIVDLGTLGGDYSWASGVNADGSVVVGTATNGADDQRPFRWIDGVGMQDLGTFGGVSGRATGVSNDGHRVAGFAQRADLRNRAFVWIDGATTGQAGGGQMYDLGVFGANLSSEAWGMSRNGYFLAGREITPTGSMPMMWSVRNIESGGNSRWPLDGLGGNDGTAYGVSNDGHYVIGAATLADNTTWRAFRWVIDGGPIGSAMSFDLGTLGGDESAAFGMTPDGAVVVGTANDAADNDRAFRWTQAGGMQSVADWLAQAGVDVGANTLEAASAVSDDGLTVVGQMREPGNYQTAYMARVAPGAGGGSGGGGSGIVDLAAFNSSLYDATQIAYAGQHLSWLPLTGAHHRSLIDYDVRRDHCFWANGDFARYGSANRDIGVGVAEAGLCGDFADGQIRAGLGLGTSHSRQTLALNGSSALSGGYAIGEIDYAPTGSNLVFSLTGLYGAWGADFRRGYMNGGSIDASTASTNVRSGLLRAKVEWLDAAQVGGASITPWASFTVAHTSVDGFTESGGGFPVRFDAQSHPAAEARIGATATMDVSEVTTIKTTLEAVHRLDAKGPDLSGQVLGAYSFTLPANGHGQTWLRAGLDIDQRLSETVLLSLSVHGATSGQDGDVSGAVGLHAGF